MTWKEIWKRMKNALLLNKHRKTRTTSNACLQYDALENENFVGLTSEHMICRKVYRVKVYFDRSKESTPFNKMDVLTERTIDNQTTQNIPTDYHILNTTNKADLFYNMVFCAKCGKPMYLHKTNPISAKQNYYICKSCCSPCQLDVFALEHLVLWQIRWVTELARKKLAGFEEIGANNSRDRHLLNDCLSDDSSIIKIQKLTPEIIHAFISKIYICNKEETGNDVEIVFTVGFREQRTQKASIITL